VHSNKQSPYLETPLQLEEQNSGKKNSALSGRVSGTQTGERSREQILQRFERWLDDVLAKEEPLEGVADELLSELEQSNGSDTACPNFDQHDLYSTWSAITALTQEVKLQGRAFKHLSDKMEPLLGLDESIERLLEAHTEALTDARRIADEARNVGNRREKERTLDAQDRVRHELMNVFIDIRGRLIIGLRTADESYRKMNEYRNSSWLNKIFIKRNAGINHMLEIVTALRKGYRLGLDRLDEVMQQLGVHEIICEGKPFDPRLMNAVDVEETVEVPDGMVLEVYRAGYMIDSEILQPAQVKVARAPEKNM
jgi:molecular chaperone GrpE (heat shock protein)